MSLPCDLKEQLQRGANVAPMLAAIAIDWGAFDVFDREVRLTALRHAGIEKPCDVGMIERPENRALLRHPLLESASLPGAMRQFQRDEPLDEPIGSLRTPDFAHAADAEQLDQRIGPDLIAGKHVRGLRAAFELGATRQRGRTDAAEEIVEVRFRLTRCRE